MYTFLVLFIYLLFIITLLCVHTKGQMATSAKSLQLQVKVISYEYIQIDINYKHYKGVKLIVGGLDV